MTYRDTISSRRDEGKMRRKRSIFDILRERMEELEAIAEEMLDQFVEKPSWDTSSQSLEPLCDVSVRSDSVIVTADLPRVDPKSIRVAGYPMI